jgi:hypothetical protein
VNKTHPTTRHDLPHSFRICQLISIPSEGTEFLLPWVPKFLSVIESNFLKIHQSVTMSQKQMIVDQATEMEFIIAASITLINRAII